MGGHSDKLLTRTQEHPRGCRCFSFDGCVVLCQRHLTSDVRPYPHTIHERALTSYGFRCDGCIPTALVTVGSNVSSLSRLLSRLNGQLISTEEGSVVVLESGDAPNLKTTLKNIIRATVTNTDGNDGYQKFLTDRAVCGRIKNIRLLY